ncbi:MAG: DUF4139 domain-containing protein [Bacteroidota bacterium]
MKFLKIHLVALFCCFLVNIHAQEGSVLYTNSKVTKVTVYLSGAQITREAEVSIEKGITNIVFDGISPYLNEQSIQLGGTSGINLLSVVHRINYLTENENSPRINELKDSIELIQFLLDQLTNKKFVSEQELDLIISNKNIKGDKGFDIAAYEEIQELYTKRLPALKDDLLKNRIEERRLLEKQNKLKNQLAELSNSYSNGKHEIVASIKSETAKKLKLDLSYYTSAASWFPAYDIRCKDINSPIQLIYKAIVQQSSGEDWSKVMLKISMGNPNLSGTKPELQTNSLGWMPVYYQNIEGSYSGYKKSNATAPAAMGNSIQVDKDERSEARFKNNTSTMTQSSLNVEFVIAIPYTINSNGKSTIIDAQTFEMPAIYNLAVVPKLDKSVFLIAEVSAKDEINQLNGMASIYFEGMYTGQSNVTPNENDSMKISLGRDKSILVERKRLKEKSSKSLLGSKKTEESVYEIIVKNTKSTPVSITIEDQIPISIDKDIEIEQIDLGGAIYDEITGKLTWKITLLAGETKKINFSFNVKYPKNKKIGNY